jgi:creatinine amidohydrolase
MRLTHLRPEQLQEAIRRNDPLIMAAGVVEYHGPHLPIGTDVRIAEYVCEQIERRRRCVLAPSLAYGPTMSWAGGPEEGEMDFDPEPLYRYAKEMLNRFIQMGFRRIYIIQHHQGMEGLQALCLKKAARELIREQAMGWGNGWGRRAPEEWSHPQLFDWITVAGIDSFLHLQYADGAMPIGHGGKGETQLMMNIDPETVKLDSLDTDPAVLPVWLQDAGMADREEGRHWLERCVESWILHIWRGEQEEDDAVRKV